MDTIGRIPVPAPVASGAVFRLVSEYGYGMSRDWKLVEHRFGELATMGVQRYGVGSGARKFQFVKSSLTYKDKQYLTDFFDEVQGSYQSFIYPAPNTDRTTFTNYEVVFDAAPLSITELTNRAQTGLTFLEIINPADAPTCTISSVVTRFPTDSLAQALASEIQIIVPLVHIKVRNAAVPDIYLSDRRIQVSNFPGAPSPTTFLPRLLGMGQPGGGDVIMSQSIDGRADNVSFKFGNADRAMSALVNDCSLEFAEIDLSLLHWGTKTLIQMWKGVILSWQVDGGPEMSVQCSDGLYPVTQAYPPRVVSRQCWKPFNADVLPGYRPCPWSTHGGGKGDPNSCDYFYNSPNGCLSHGMSQYFGGHPEQPQTVVYRDNSTGSLSHFLNPQTVVSTSILSDSIWGQPLPEIWCNSLGSPQRAMWAQCMVAAVREEGDYEELMGIVGAGPLGAFEGMSIQTNADGYKFVVAPTADGFFPQGFQVDGQLNVTGYQPSMGLRQSTGPDPAYLATAPTQGQDAFSLGQGSPQRWDLYDKNFSNDGVPNSIIPYAAGTAVLEMRYNKADTAALPTTAESHSMQCPVRLGLTGSVWDVNGNRTLVPGVINPFWVAANTYLRALGLQAADAATQANYLVLNSITNSQGMGAADIANQLVNPIVGTVIPGYTVTAAGQALAHYNLDHFNGTFTYQDSKGATVTMTIQAAQGAGYLTMSTQPNQEYQFMFQGIIGEAKPFRDWLTEILNCSLGYFCFEFGKLRLGIRYSAVPVDSFGLGSMLYQSLSITPLSATFEYLKIQFANVELQFQRDMAEYQDKDHALYYGRAGRPLSSSMSSVGCSTLSQGLRIAVTRTREEIGGILRKDLSNPYIEWDNNKRIAFKSTLLALNNEVGDVIAVQHPDIPTYPGAAPGSRPGSNGPMAANTWPFRIKKWMLHSDWSVSIMADSCVDSCYDLEVGPQPTGVGPRPLPVMFFPEPLGQWAPYQIQADPNDALFPNEFSFNLQQTFEYEGDGRLLTSAVVAGCLPVNQFVPDCGAPDAKKGSVSWSTTGGQIPGGTTLFVQICAAVLDASNHVQQYSPPSQVLILQVPVGTDTNSLTITNIKWPPVSGVTGYVLFASADEDLISGQQAGLGLPSSITFNGPVQRQTYAVPDFDLSMLRLRAQVLIHGGVIGAGVSALNTDRIVAFDAADPSGQDQWTGRVLAIIGRQQGDGIAPWAHFNITGFTSADGTFFVDRNPITAGVQVGDIIVVCFKGADNSSNPYVVGDPGLSNSTNIPPHTGEAVNDPNRIGRMVRVIAGTSRGKSAKIVSNTATTYTLDQPLPIDATSIWIVCDPGWNYSKDVVLNNADPEKTTVSAIEINNYLGLALLVEGVNIDAQGTIVDDDNACVRMLFIPGVQGTTNVTT